MAKADRRGPDRNTIIALSCFAFFGAMIGVAYAAVPLYQIFCQVTGYGGTTQRVEQYADRVLDKTIRVRFDANVSGGLPWEFTPDQREIELKIRDTLQDYLSAERRRIAPTDYSSMSS